MDVIFAAGNGKHDGVGLTPAPIQAQQVAIELWVCRLTIFVFLYEVHTDLVGRMLGELGNLARSSFMTENSTAGRSWRSTIDGLATGHRQYIITKFLSATLYH